MKRSASYNVMLTLPGKGIFKRFAGANRLFQISIQGTHSGRRALFFTSTRNTCNSVPFAAKGLPAGLCDS